MVLRAAGWQVPVMLYCAPPPANDVPAIACRFLFGHAPNARLGPNIFDAPKDPKALAKALRDLAVKTGNIEFHDLHRSPRCPAKHFHKTRRGTGPCYCIAQREAAARTRGYRFDPSHR